LPRSDSGPGGGAQCKRYGTAAFKRRLAGDRRGAAWSQSGQTDGRCDKFREGPSPQEALLPAGVFIQRERQTQTMRGKRPACALRSAHNVTKPVSFQCWMIFLSRIMVLDQRMKYWCDIFLFEGEVPITKPN